MFQEVGHAGTYLESSRVVVCVMFAAACNIQPEIPQTPRANLDAAGGSLPVADKFVTASLGALHNIALYVLRTKNSTGAFRTQQEFMAQASVDLARVLAVNADFWDVALVENMHGVLRENDLSSPFGPFGAFDPWRVAEFLSSRFGLSSIETQVLNRFLDLALRLDHGQQAEVLRSVDAFSRKFAVNPGDGTLLGDVIDVFVHSHDYWYGDSTAPGKDVEITPLLDDPMVPLVDVLFTILGSKLTTPIGGALIGALASAMYIGIQIWEPTGDPGAAGMVGREARHGTGDGVRRRRPRR